ncbi:MAG: hypothetical protein ACKOFG_01360 [Limnohabitans sp.]
MKTVPRQIVVLGAPGTGAEAMRTQLHLALAAHPALKLSDAPSPSNSHSFALLMGLDPSPRSPAERAAQSRGDAQLRQELQALGLPFQVVYGDGDARLSHALLALGLPTTDEAARQSRETAQFDLNRGRTPWSCEKCSDPECEHKLFTGLLGQDKAPSRSEAAITERERFSAASRRPRGRSPRR